MFRVTTAIYRSIFNRRVTMIFKGCLSKRASHTRMYLSRVNYGEVVRSAATALQVGPRQINTDATYYLVRHFSVLRSLMLALCYTTLSVNALPCNYGEERFAKKVRGTKEGGSSKSSQISELGSPSDMKGKTGRF